MKQPINEIKRMQHLAGLITESEYQESTIVNEGSGDDKRTLELIQMYVDNYSDEGMDAESALKKIDDILQGKLDGYDKAFMAGEEDNY